MVSEPDPKMPSTGSPDMLAEREFTILNGSLFVGDTRVALASESILFTAKNEADRSLRLAILETDSIRFAEAWQRMIHSTRRTAAGYPLSGLTPAAIGSQATGLEGGVQQEPGGAGLTDSDVVYADTIYASIVYADSMHPSSAAVESSQNADDVLAPVTLAVTGEGADSQRRVLNIEGIQCVGLDRCSWCTDLTEVMIRFAPRWPIDRLIRVFPGI